MCLKLRAFILTFTRSSGGNAPELVHSPIMRMFINTRVAQNHIAEARQNFLDLTIEFFDIAFLVITGCNYVNQAAIHGLQRSFGTA